MAIRKKTVDRINSGLKKFRPILKSAKSRDVNESDTVTIIVDIFEELFGYDKYSEITSEHAIRGTYCDLAIKLDGEIHLIIEVKAIGIDLKEPHIKQAVDYAANAGVEWVCLTNGITWQLYKVVFGRPIQNQLIVEYDLLEIDPSKEGQLDIIALICRESWAKAMLKDFQVQKEALDRFTIAALLKSEQLLDDIRRELRRVSPKVKISSEQILGVLSHEVIKREVQEGEKAEAAKKLVGKAASKSLRKKKVKKQPGETTSPDANPEIKTTPNES